MRVELCAGTTMNVAQWLNAIDLGQYEALFREHEIDVHVLPDLVEADLEKIGVPLGHRKRLMRAIAALSASPTAPKPASAQPSRSPQTSGADAERRPITVVFCDLVGSTTISAALDAEDWRNLVSTYLDAASEAVTQMGGRVAKKLGDGLMALFGHPIAQENDSERAVRAALAIQRALAELNRKNAGAGRPELVARIGVATGPVVVDSAGEIFGDAPNIAARVQALADPGTVMITARVQRQTAGLFVVEDKGAHDLKGVPVPVALYRIVRASGGRRGGARILTPLVGREDELSQLQRRWSRALEGEGQFVQIVGEPGIGKSRLIEEFRAKLVETPHTWVEWAASQLLQNTPLHPLAEWGRLRFGGADATDEGRLADLENTLGLIGIDAAEYAPLLAPLVDIPLREERRAKLPPEEMRRRQLAAMTAWVLAGARTQPVVLAFEDLHWADPTSLDLMARLAERGAQSPLLVVATTRPEFRAPWAMRSHHGVVSLAPLDRAQVRRMVGEIANRHALSDETIDGVGERTGGVPLFVEEVTRLLLERDAQGGAQAIPPTLQQSLAARLDRLGEAREVAQIGAVLGRDFSYRLLSDVSSSAAGFDEPRLQAGLDRLTEADLLFVDGAPPAAAYRFKHALIQDAAYDSLLKSRRQALHRRAAEALRDANAQPEAIAHHFTEAGLDDPAIEWWGKAGDQALRRSAFQEAIAHLGKAIAMADKAGETAQRAPGRVAAVNQRLPQLHAAYGNALIAARGHGAPETMEAFARARKSASGDEDAPERFAADYGLWVGSYVRGDLPSMRTHAAAFLAGVAAMPDSPEAGVAHRVLGTTHCFAGEYAEARDHLERALTLFQPGRDDDLAFRFGQDAGVAAMCYLAIASWPLGNVGRAVSLVDGVHERLASVAHIGTRPYAKLHAAMFELMRGDRARAAQNGSETARLAREHDLPLWRAYGAFFEGLATAELGALAEGLSDMRRGVESLRQQGLLNFDGLYKIALADAETRAGDRVRAIAILDEALVTADRLGYRAFEAELNRTRGEILLKRDPANPAPAEEAFQAAIAVAKRQGTRSFELRAALSLAKLYQSTNRAADAHAVLAPALDGFPAISLLPSGRRAGDEGYPSDDRGQQALTPDPSPEREREDAGYAEMPELAEAQALLAALSQTDEVKAQAAQRQRLTQLQAAYGNALIAARGYGAPETTEAFARARESASGDKDAPGRLAADYGLWASSYVRGELPAMRAHAAVFLCDVEAKPDSGETGVAHRVQGITHQFAGEYVEARHHLERALALFQPGRDDDLAFRFGHDAGVAAMVYLSMVLWPLGEVDRAISLIDRTQTRIAGTSHIGTHGMGKTHAALFELMRGHRARAALYALELADITRERDLPMFHAFSVFLEGWAASQSGAPAQALEDMRRGVELLRERNALHFDGLLKIALAEAEARAGDEDRPIAILDEALATADRLGYRAFEAELHRARGEMLLRRDRADAAPAERALLKAIAVAREQRTRGFELRAALSLARLFQSTARPADAHAALAPALEGFASTPEMPEIAEAQALFATLRECEEVKLALAPHKRRLHLQTAYAQALLWSKGFAAEETRAAFERTGDLATRAELPAERFPALFGQYLWSLLRGNIRSAEQIAERFLQESEAQGRLAEAGVGHRIVGLSSLFLGDLLEARSHLEVALNTYDRERDSEVRERFALDTGVAARVYLALTSWLVGDLQRPSRLIEEAMGLGSDLGHLPDVIHALWYKVYIQCLRNDPQGVAADAENLSRTSQQHGVELFVMLADLALSWARGRLGDVLTGAKELRRSLAEYTSQGNLLWVPAFHAFLAELEDRAGEVERALSTIDEGLATAQETGQNYTDAFLYRLRGDLLLKFNPDDPEPAEDAYRAAITIATKQGARSYELLASLSLAKLYQSAARPEEAHAVLAPALEGFSPTPEMPEIAEALELVAAIKASTHL